MIKIAAILLLPMITMNAFANTQASVVEKTIKLFNIGEIQAVEYISNSSKVVWHLIYNHDNGLEFEDLTSSVMDRDGIQTKKIKKHFDKKFGIHLFQSEYIDTHKSVNTLESIRLKDLIITYPDQFSRLSNEMLIISRKENMILNHIRITNSTHFNNFREYDVVSISIDSEEIEGLSSTFSDIKDWLKSRILTRFYYKNNRGESKPILEIDLDSKNIQLGMISNHNITDKNNQNFGIQNVVDNRFNDFVKAFHENGRQLVESQGFSYNFGTKIKASQKPSFTAVATDDGRNEKKIIKYNLEADGSLKLILSFKGQRMSQDVRYSQRFAGLTYNEPSKEVKSEFQYSIGAFGYDKTENQRTSSTDYVGISASFVW